MKSIIQIMLIFSFTAIWAQTECSIYNYYGDFLKIEKVKHGDSEYVRKSVNPIKNECCVKDLVNNNILYIDYFLTHFLTGKDYLDLKSIEDSLEMQLMFEKKLVKDSSFNSLMIEFADKTINNKLEKDSVGIDYVLNIAVKYFAILRITDEGNFSTSICTGFNLIKQTEPERNPHIEAFAFSSVIKNLNSEEYNLYKDFVSFVKNIYKLNLGTEKNERLLRAQGAIFMAMRENSKLREMLIEEYKEKKEFLPFILYY